MVNGLFAFGFFGTVVRSAAFAYASTCAVSCAFACTVACAFACAFAWLRRRRLHRLHRLRRFAASPRQRSKLAWQQKRSTPGLQVMCVAMWHWH